MVPQLILLSACCAGPDWILVLILIFVSLHRHTLNLNFELDLPGLVQVEVSPQSQHCGQVRPGVCVHATVCACVLGREVCQCADRQYMGFI